ncbi:hypothetical protein QTP88_004813 [Uroleucon formosanum]
MWSYSLNNKLVIDGYVIVQNKVLENWYNWEFEKRVHRKTLETTENCNVRPLILVVLIVTPTVIDFRSDIKKGAHSTSDKSSQISQEVVSNIPLCIQPYLPGPETVRKIIKLCIITNFEKAAINAIHNIFPECVQKGCIFHLAQNFCRKIQSCGLATEYSTDEHFIYIPIEIYNWFDETYGKIHQTFRNGTISQSPPLFPPEFWSVGHNNKYEVIHSYLKNCHKIKINHDKFLHDCVAYTSTLSFYVISHELPVLVPNLNYVTTTMSNCNLSVN